MVVVVMVPVVVVAATTLYFFELLAALVRLFAALAVALDRIAQLVFRLVNLPFTLSCLSSALAWKGELTRPAIVNNATHRILIIRVIIFSFLG